jgi:AmiR/NasT family two-component response regulator
VSCEDAPREVTRSSLWERREVHQAAGRVSVQVGCRVEQALALMREQAEASRLTVDEIAAAVLDGSLRFD